MRAVPRGHAEAKGLAGLIDAEFLCLGANRWVQIGFAQVNPQADNRAPKLTLPNSHPAACHHRLALQSNKVYPPPCTTACSTWAVLAVDKRYSLGFGYESRAGLPTFHAHCCDCIR